MTFNLVKDRPVWPNIHRFDVVSCTLTCGAWSYWRKTSKCCQNIAKTLPRRCRRIQETDTGENAVIHFLIYYSLTSLTFGAVSGHRNSLCGLGDIGKTSKCCQNIDKTLPQRCHCTAHHMADIAIHFFEFLRLLLCDHFFLLFFCHNFFFF